MLPRNTERSDGQREEGVKDHVRARLYFYAVLCHRCAFIPALFHICLIYELWVVFIGSGHVDGLVKSFKKINPNTNTFIFGKPRASLRCFSVLKLCLTTEIWKQGTMGPVSAEREEKKNPVHVCHTAITDKVWCFGECRLCWNIRCITGIT